MVFLPSVVMAAWSYHLATVDRPTPRNDRHRGEAPLSASTYRLPPERRKGTAETDTTRNPVKMQLFLSPTREGVFSSEPSAEGDETALDALMPLPLEAEL